MSPDPKITEKRLKESEEKYKLILENANDLITIINHNFEREYINEKAYFELLGYKNEDIIGKTPLSFLHPDDVKKAREALRDGFEEEEGRNEMRVRHKDGHYLWLERKGKSFIDIDGKKKAIIVSRDITERKIAEEKINESEEKHRSLINNLTDIILEIDLKGNVTYVSSQCYDVMGYKPTELKGKNALDFIHSEDVLLIADAMKEALRTDKVISVPSYRLLHKNGDIIFASAQGKHVKINEMDRFIVTIRDITTQTKIEQKLKESETKYRLISENANDLILILKQNLDIEYVNENPLLTLTGYSIDEVIGKRALNFIHLDDAKKALNLFYEAFDKEGYGTIEARIKHKKGHSVYVEINGSLFHNEKGEPRALLITRDITERKKAENDKKEEYKKLEELSQIKSESIMIASHELKTPLSSVYAASQFLLKNFKEQLGEDVLRFIEIIYRGSQKLRQLIENMLDASRLESDDLNLNLNEENLVEIINDCISDLKHWADKRNLNIKADLTEQFILEVDRIRIEQVIINLLSNAIKFTPPNGNILITLNDREKYVEISIKDTGIGLTKKEKEKLFQKFGKIERFRKQLDIDTEGTGLGLYISKEIVELHKGKIIVKSQGRNKGSTFIIRLPK
ncbi:MAG: PAS domain S-box protein [Candidatus Lokiarchaeota archaeon]|nr:PAS domain S-box protein [Candidatus Lokiarchaeota archaeon]